MNTALLIIDVQRGMFDTKNVPQIYDGKGLLDRLQTLIQCARSSGLPVIYVQHSGPKGHPVEKGTKNFEIHPQIKPFASDAIVEKKNPDSFYNTKLDSVLNQLKITDLVIAGIQTEYCIDTTCRIAYSKGYQVTLIADCHTTWDTEKIDAESIIRHHNTIIESSFGKVQFLSEVNLDTLT